MESNDFEKGFNGVLVLNLNLITDSNESSYFLLALLNLKQYISTKINA
jgi:hypothetical protein